MMKKSLKSFLSLVLALVMVLGMIPGTAMAALKPDAEKAKISLVLMKEDASGTGVKFSEYDTMPTIAKDQIFYVGIKVSGLTNIEEIEQGFQSLGFALFWDKTYIEFQDKAGNFINQNSIKNRAQGTAQVMQTPALYFSPAVVSNSDDTVMDYYSYGNLVWTANATSAVTVGSSSKLNADNASKLQGDIKHNYTTDIQSFGELNPSFKSDGFYALIVKFKALQEAPAAGAQVFDLSVARTDSYIDFATAKNKVHYEFGGTGSGNMELIVENNVSGVNIYPMGKPTLGGTATITGASTPAPVVGDVLTADTTGVTVSDDSTVTFSYQWKRGSTNISGATNKTYTLVAADVGQTISCEVTAADCNGKLIAGPTAAVVKPDISTVTGGIMLTGTATYGQELTASLPAALNSGSTVTWYRNSTNSTTGGTQIKTGSNAAALKCALGKTEVGQYVYAVVSNTGYTGTKTSNVLGPVAKASVNVASVKLTADPIKVGATTLTAPAKGSVTGVSGDTISITATATYADSEEGTNKTVALSNISYKVGNADASDYYEITGTPTGTGTVNALDPSAKPVVTIDDITIAEGGQGTLTAKVTGASGTLSYTWTGPDGAIGTDAASITVSKGGTYTCVVTNTETGKAATASDPATATVSIKTKEAITLTTKANLNSFKTGAVSNVKVSDLVDIAPAGAKDLIDSKGTVKFYEKVSDAKDADPGASCTCGVADPENDTHADDCPYKPATPAVAAVYKEVTTLEAGKTYYATYGVTGAENDDYKLAADVTIKGMPTDAEIGNYIKVETVSGGGGGGGISGITVRYNVGEHGTLTGNSSESVKRGEKPAKVPTVTAKEGYKFLGWSLDGKTVVDPTTVTINSSTTFTALYQAVKNTYISGYPDSTFRPDAQVSRAEIASMLARLTKDFNSNATYSGNATDVENGAWYANFVNFGMNKGFISGYKDGSFQPDGKITRGEFASMMARYMGLTTGSKQFTDTADHWASSSIAALADAGIVTGYNDGSFQPNSNLTRAEAVQMINTALKVQALTGAAEIVPTDVASTHWAYTQILAAMNTDIKDIVK